MKIGIITFHATTNYGAFLQAYALQTFLQDKLNINTEILDYQTKLQKQLCAMYVPVNSIQNVVKNCLTLFHYHRLKKREYEFGSMKREFLQLTKPLNTYEDVKKVYKDYDLLISGSDQIWNGEIRGFSEGGQEPYFLKDCPKRKITYATSIGSKDSPIVRKVIEQNLDSINAYAAISVREAVAQKTLSDYMEQRIEIVVDPIFLLNREDYHKLFNNYCTPHKKFILLYTINFEHSLLEKTSEIAKELRLPVFVPYSCSKAIYCKKYGFHIIYDAGPGCFLDLLDKAELVITDSFHGTAFSIHNKKDFFCYQKMKDNDRIKDDRLNTLLKMAGLEDRILCQSSNVKLCHRTTHYVDSSLESAIDSSKMWLKKAIDNA